MTIDTRTLVLVIGRLVDLASMPALFNDHMSTMRVSNRLARIIDWAGSTGRIVASEHIRRRETPPPGKRKWARGGYRSDDTQQI